MVVLLLTSKIVAVGLFPKPNLGSFFFTLTLLEVRLLLDVPSGLPFCGLLGDAVC